MSVLTAQKPPTRMHRMVWPVIGATLTVGAAFYIRAVDPNNGGYPFCPLKAVTGIDCPACGGLRCVHALMNGDIGTALDQNLLAVIALPLIVVWAVFALAARWRGDDLRPVRVGPDVDADGAAAVKANALRALWVGFIVVTVVFTVARNVPGVPFLPSGVG
ncbi:MAG: DUF2752 domain-containing protein [Candidatus Nanopelagicales bacterium]